MPHPDAEHSLRIQLATALRERDTANARADAAQSRIADLTADATGHMHRCAKVNGKWECASGCAIPALAAARRECHLLRARFEKVAEFHEEQLRLLDSEPAKEWAGSDKTGYYAAWKTAHTVAAHEAREALDAPASAAGEEGTR